MKKIVTILLLLCTAYLTACGNAQRQTEGDGYQIYEVNKDETKLCSREFVTDEMRKNRLAALMIAQLSTASAQSTDSKPAISDTVVLNTYSVIDESVTLDFAASYQQLPLTSEVLTRAAIVRTLTQIDGINYVSFTIEGLPLVNRSGLPIGVMTAEQFIDNSSNEINTEEKAALSLYFADETGEKLVRVNREVIYNSNISLEKLVMEQMILGIYADETEEYHAQPSVNPDTKVISIMVSDGVCYVNMDSTFLTQITNVSAEVTIYSIVNSLVELPNINKVQFSIDGKTDFSLKETMPLSDLYERNLELVEGA